MHVEDHVSKRHLFAWYTNPVSQSNEYSMDHQQCKPDGGFLGVFS